MRLIMLHFVRKHFCLDNSLNNLEHKTFNSLPTGLFGKFSVLCSFSNRNTTFYSKSKEKNYALISLVFNYSDYLLFIDASEFYQNRNPELTVPVEDLNWSNPDIKHLHVDYLLTTESIISNSKPSLLEKL